MKNAVEIKTGHPAEHGKLFQVIFEQAGVGVALFSTASGKFLKINKKYCDIVGYSEEEMLNTDFQSITYPEDLKSDFEIIELLKSGKIREFSKEKRYIHKNGDIVWVNITVSPMWDFGEKPDYHITVVQDITQRKANEKQIKLHEEHIKNLLDLHRMRGATEKELIDFTLESGLNILKSKIAFIGLISEDETHMINFGRSKEVMNECAISQIPVQYLIAKAGLWGEIVRQRRHIIENDYETSSLYKKGYPQGHVPIKRFLGVPIFSGNRIVAVAAFANKLSEYTESDASSLTSLLNEMWDILEHRRAENAILIGKKYFKSVFDSMNDAFFIHDGNTGQILDVNQRMCQMYGYTHDEALRLSIEDISAGIEPYTQKYALEKLEKAKSGQPHVFEWLAKDKTGRTFWIEVNTRYDLIAEEGRFFVTVHDITERKQAEDTLKEAILKARSEKNKSEAIISALGDGLIIQDKDYKIIYQNKIQTEIFGEHNGEFCYKVYEGRETICEDCPVERTFSDGKIHRSERAVKIGSGISYFELISSPLRDPDGNIIAGIKIVRDMTEKRQVEEEMRSTKDRLQFLLSASPAIIYTLNTSGDFGATYLSENVTKLLGYRSSDFTENLSFWQDRIHPDDKERVISNLESIFESGQQIIEYRFLDKDGVYRWMRDELTLIRDENGMPREIAGYWIDITKSKHAQEERMQLLAKEQSARAEAEAAKKLEKLKSMFIASTSHELRTPLNSIIGFTGVLLQGWSGELNQEQKEYLEMINSSSKHLLELIIDILDISKIESGSIDLKVSVFDLREVVDEAITTLGENIKEKGLEMIIEVKNIYMKTDRMRLLQCIMNLIGNSVKYTEKGNIKISAKNIENKVDISVTDTGIGIKTQDIPRLFTPFVRLESPLTPKTSGTGLGLYLTKKLARDVLGGEIYVKSKFGKGSTFTIQIPVEVETTGQRIFRVDKKA